jgi:hypothetical protein
VRRPRDDRKLGVGNPVVGCRDVLDRDEVIVAEHQQSPRPNVSQPRRGQGRLLAVQASRLLHQDLEVILAVRRDLAVGGGEIWQRRIRVLGRLLGYQAVAVKASTDHHQASDQVRSPDGRQKSGEGSVAVTDQVGRTADDFLEQGDGVVDHRLERHRPRDVRRSAVTAPVVAEHVEVLGQRFDVLLVEARIDQCPVHEDERVSGTALVIPAADAAQVDVRRHAGT